jgi:hypothetical protein
MVDLSFSAGSPTVSAEVSRQAKLGTNCATILALSGIHMYRFSAGWQ